MEKWNAIMFSLYLPMHACPHKHDRILFSLILLGFGGHLSDDSLIRITYRIMHKGVTRSFKFVL